MVELDAEKNRREGYSLYNYIVSLDLVSECPRTTVESHRQAHALYRALHNTEKWSRAVTNRALKR